MGKSVEQMAQQLRGNATKYDEIYQQELKKRLMDEQARQRRRELMQQIERNAAIKKTAEPQKPIADKMPNISIQPVNAVGFPPMKAATGNLLQPGTNGKPLATPFPLKEYQFNTQNPFTPPMKKPAENTRTWTPQDRAAATSDALKQQQTLAAGYSKAAHSAAQQNKLSLWEQIKLGAGQLGVKGLSAIDTVNNNVAFNGTAPSAAAAFVRNNTPGYKPVDTAGALEQKISPLSQRADALKQQEEALAYGKMAKMRESLERAARAAADFDPNNTAGAKENYTGGSPMTSAWLPFLEALSMAGTSSDATTPVSAVNGIGQQAVIDGMREIKNDLAPAAEYLTDEQRSVYNYYARSDADKAAKYLETLQYATDAAKVAEQSDIAKRAGDNGAAGVAYTLAMHAGGQASSPLALLDVAGRGLKNAASGEYMPLNQNSDAMAAQALPDAAMTGMQSDMSPIGRTATDLAVGIADNVANFALLGAAAPAVMAAQSGGRGAYDATQKGATPGQALASGAAQGAAEYLGESFSFKKLDNVLHGAPAKSVGDWVKSVGGQMANEFSEEAATEVMNILSDMAVMRDKSDAARYADDYIAAHGASTQAQQDMALALYCAKRVGSAGLAGAITGGVLGGGAQYRNNRAFFPPMMDNKTENPTLLSAAHTAYSGAGMDSASTAAEREAGFSDGSIVNFAQNAAEQEIHINETAVNDNPDTHTPEQIAQIEAYKQAVNPEIIEFVEAVHQSPQNRWMTLETSKVSDREAAEIAQLTGVNVEGYTHVIKPSSIQHIKARHGENGQHDSSMKNIEDIARIDWVVQNYDTVSGAVRANGKNYISKEFRNSDGTLSKTVLFSKAIDGTFYVVEAVPDSKAKKMQLVSAYISKNGAKKETYHVPNDAQSAPRLYVRNEHELVSNNSIANSAQNATGNLPMQKETAQTQNEEQKRPHNIDAFFPPMEARTTAPQMQSTSSKEEITPVTARTTAPQMQSTSSKEEITPVTARTDAPQMQSTSSKAQRVQNRYENEFVNRVGEMMSVPGGARREYLRPLAQKMREEAKRDGKISKETADEAFETAYEQGVEIESEFFDTYKDLKGRLRNQKLTLDSENQKSREYADMRDRYFGSLKLTNTGGTPVDVVYMELCEEYPGLFDREIANPLDQLERIGEVARSIQRTASNLDAYYGDFAQEFKRDARAEFDDAVEKLMEDIDKVKRYEDDVEQQREIKSVQQPEPIDIAAVQQAYQQEQKLRRKADRTMAQELLTKKDKKTVEKLMRADIEIDDVKSENRDGILRVYAAKKAAEDVLAPVKQYNAQRRAALMSEAQEAVEGSEAWKDKKTGLQYSTETMERNIRDIVKDKTEADKIVNTYFKPVHKHTADATRFKNEMREEIASLKLNQDESIYLQIYGEMRGVEAAHSMGLKRPGTEYENLKKQATEYLAEHKSEIDEAKIEDAVKVFRDTYDTVFAKMNEAYIENGYRPSEYRSGYFPHFQENKADTLILKMAKKMGFDIQTDELPTDIAGLTYNFKPGRKWNPFAKQRMGFKTTYDALKGFDLYIEVAADVIYHTQDIQKLRALEDAVRTKNSTAGIKAEIEEIRENDTLTDEQKQALLQDLYKRDKSHLNQFAQELTEYSNLLASKKSIVDRVVEKDTGRVIYSVMQNLENRIAANMVAINPGSWLTNFIPITQASAECSTGSMLKAARDTVKAYWKDDGFADISTFLTNRKGSEQLSRTGLQKLSEKLSSPMMWIDSFASNVVTRAKYLDNIKSGIDANTAMEQADEYAAGLIGDRSKGSLPTGFERKNPLWKLVTMFQVEANNQLRYLVKDLPRAKQDEALGQLVVALLKYTLGAYLFNDLYEKLVGRRPALDFLGIANEAVGDMTGYQLPNVVDAAQGIVSGKGVDFTTERRGAGRAIVNLAKNTAEEIPFVGGLLGGGRLPVMSAISDPMKILENAGGLISGEKNAKKAWMDIREEVAKPVYYMAFPFGGGQVKKAVEGIKTVAMGGSYDLNSDGEAVLQFPVENANLGTYAKAAAFGKYSLQTAQDYVNGGFKAKSAGYTKTYKAALDAGMSGDEFRQTWGDMDVDKNGSIAQGEGAKALGNANITQEQKEILWKNFASDASIEKYDKAKTQGCKQEYFDMIMHADADASGKITKKELEAYFKEAKLNAQVENLLRQINKG